MNSVIYPCPVKDLDTRWICFVLKACCFCLSLNTNFFLKENMWEQSEISPVKGKLIVHIFLLGDFSWNHRGGGVEFQIYVG